MTFQDDIYLTVLQAKDTSGIWLAEIDTLEKSGEAADECCYIKLIFLVKLIKFMEKYYSDSFNGGLGSITPAYPCLTLAQAQSLLEKLKTLIGV